MSAQVVLEAGDTLGESPVWDAAAGELWWVDIKRFLLHRYQPVTGGVDRWELPETPGALAVRDDGSLLLAVRSGFATFDPGTGLFSLLHRPEPDRAGNRFNDGKCDPRGRFWAASMDDSEQERTGALYRYESDGSCTRVLDGLGIPNTLAWTPDARTFYFAETVDRIIYAFDMDPATGAIDNRRVLAVVPEPAFPDGSAIDAEGCLWNAQWDGWRLNRYRPDGTLDREIEMPVQRPTSCAFGGPGLDVLFVTSARKGLTGEELSAQPMAGSLFSIEVDVPGLEVPRFGDRGDG
ncbi:MAG: SMP-30/gluconolactonase/LRE family protein [Acidimicrobiia bacterium]